MNKELKKLVGVAIIERSILPFFSLLLDFVKDDIEELNGNFFTSQSEEVIEWLGRCRW